MKTLNIGKLAKEIRTVVIQDVKYAVREMNVQDFITLTKTADDLDAKEATFTEQLEANINSILTMTTIPNEVLRALTLDELGTLSNFVRGVDLEEAAEGDKEKK